ncbi:lipopolysaccharide-modifying protein [Devosia limi DSM 17137]|uniref:Glycosyl transferase family 90 n=1 Tax=Devosia limi DSM 17137 TaxID=1121477 RepID=A0A0F5LNT6_9HYPH|nr:glycosyl transferase family 90 [Devosia limi]KKB83975.1 lipopolysaccharide-modifying protein [Devosia limi DSM 17137]SHE45505.1 Glycosyl transferase family 90 [Devosia limi DSM 17137]
MTYAISLDPARIYCALPAPAYFRREFERVGARPPKIRIRYRQTDNPPHDVLIERRGDGFTIVLEQSSARLFTRFMRHKVCAYTYWLSLCAPAVTGITVNASDGEEVSRARFSPSVRFPQHVALPDPHFFQNLGFARARDAGRQAPDWHGRSDEIVWRGGMNGTGWMSLEPQDADNPAVLQRIRMVFRLKGLDGVDARLMDMHRSVAPFTALADAQGLLAAPLPATTWLGHKFAIDIDGYTNTWSNLLVRLLYGCCVLKVGSQFGYRQWYYDALRPFEHYVPVAADMSDFAEKIDWVRSHPAEAAAIAARGQALAQTLTFAREARRAADLIEAHWDRTEV